MIDCDPSALTVLLRDGDAGGPANSKVAKRLADYTKIPLPDEAVEEVGEMASVALRLKRINPDRWQFMADQLHDVLLGEEHRVRATTKPPDAGDHAATTGKKAPSTGAPGTGAGARAPQRRYTRH